MHKLRLLLLLSTTTLALAALAPSAASALSGTNGYSSAFANWQHAKLTRHWVKPRGLRQHGSKTTAHVAYITEHCGGPGYLYSYAGNDFVNAEGWQGGNLSGILRAAWGEVIWPTGLFQMCGENNSLAIYSDGMGLWATVETPYNQPEFVGEWNGTLRANGPQSTYLNRWNVYSVSGVPGEFDFASLRGSIVGNDLGAVHGVEWGLLRDFLGCCSLGNYSEGLWADNS